MPFIHAAKENHKSRHVACARTLNQERDKRRKDESEKARGKDSAALGTCLNLHSNKCIATSNKGITTSSTKLLVVMHLLLLVMAVLLVASRFVVPKATTLLDREHSFPLLYLW